MVQSAQSIDELHGEGLLHSDVKADNFLARLRLDDEGVSNGVEVKVRLCTCGTDLEAFQDRIVAGTQPPLIFTRDGLVDEYGFSALNGLQKMVEQCTAHDASLRPSVSELIEALQWASEMVTEHQQQ